MFGVVLLEAKSSDHLYLKSTWHLNATHISLEGELPVLLDVTVCISW